jgi:hypothetical protein
VKEIADTLTTEIRKRFAQTIGRKKHADKSAEAGCEFVEASLDTHP